MEALDRFPDLPTSIVLEESSGPVSPRFQYSIEVLLTRDGDKVFLDVRRDGPAKLAVAKEIPLDALEELWRELSLHGVMDQGGDLVGEEKRRRKGISFNTLEVITPLATMRLDYTLAALEAPENAERARIVAAVKKLAGLERA